MYVGVIDRKGVEMRPPRLLTILILLSCAEVISRELTFHASHFVLI